MNHWVSARGEHDVCTACGEKVPNVPQAKRPLIITGECRGARRVVRSGHLVYFVCRTCADKPPYFGKADMDLEISTDRAGWCALCRRWIGDDSVCVPKRAPATEIVQAFVDALGAVVSR